MKDLQIGELYRIINADGEEVSLGILLEICQPHSLPYNLVEEESVHTNHWNYKVLAKGRVRHISTTTWSLIPV